MATSAAQTSGEKKATPLKKNHAQPKPSTNSNVFQRARVTRDTFGELPLWTKGKSPFVSDLRDPAAAIRVTPLPAATVSTFYPSSNKNINPFELIFGSLERVPVGVHFSSSETRPPQPCLPDTRTPPPFARLAHRQPWSTLRSEMRSRPTLCSSKRC